MEAKKIVHVHLKNALHDEADYYFGSVAAIYDVLTEEAMGIKYASLLNLLARNGYRYENTKCIIKTGTILRKKRSK